MFFGSSYITSQMYLSNWRQKDFFEFPKNFQIYFGFWMLKISKIDITKKKINIGFFLLILGNLIQLHIF